MIGRVRGKMDLALRRRAIIASRKAEKRNKNEKSKRMNSVERPRNGGTWTENQFIQKIVSHLRAITREWKPSKLAISKACVSRIQATCNMCKKVKPKMHETLYRGVLARRPAFNADHDTTAVPLFEVTSLTFNDYCNAIENNIDPVTLFKRGVDWNTRIERIFSETGWEALCVDCHKDKTDIENTLRKEGKRLLTQGKMSLVEIHNQIEGDKTKLLAGLKLQKQKRETGHVICKNQ